MKTRGECTKGLSVAGTWYLLGTSFMSDRVLQDNDPHCESLCRIPSLNVTPYRIEKVADTTGPNQTMILHRCNAAFGSNARYRPVHRDIALTMTKTVRTPASKSGFPPFLWFRFSATKPRG